MPYALNKIEEKTLKQVQSRVNYLYNINQPYLAARSRTRALMNGGKGALDVLLKDLPTNDDTLPAANHIKSGIERFSEMISPAPDLRINPPGERDRDKDARSAEKRERIVSSYDERCKIVHQLAQGSLWLPGYGFYSWKVCEKKDRNGYRYPKAELRDPFTSWPAEWGVDQQPVDIAYQRWIDPDTLATVYPHAKNAIEEAVRKGRGGGTLSGGAVDLSGFAPSANTHPGWDGVTGGIEVIEYVDAWGTYVYSPAVGDFLDKYEHPLDRAPFVVPRRFTFDTLAGHFDDVIGLASVMAKLTLLTQIVMEDAAFAPVVVNGRMDAPFRKGRDAVNHIEGGDAKYLYQNFPYQMFTEIDRVENHLRSTTGYSKQADGESPISFVTGQGLEELGSSLSRQVQRYQLVIGDSLEELDSIRLEWDERAFGNEKRFVEGTRKGQAYSEEYVPSEDIGGRWGTRRVYGIMAGLDEPRRLVGLLQMLAAEVIDVQTVQENLSDIDNAPKVRDRILEQKIESTQFEMLTAMAGQGDPNAMRALVAIKKDPKRMNDVLEEFFKPPEEEEAQQQPAGPTGQEQFAEVLTRLTASGNAGGGIQTQRELAGGQGRAA